MKQFIFLVPVILLACGKDQNRADAGETFQKLEARMWKQDSIAYVFSDGRREVSIPATMNSQYVKFTSTQIEYYYSYNLEAPEILESDAAVYRQPNVLEGWVPGRTGGPPSYKIAVDSVSNSRLVYSFLNSPDYLKTRVYYYHAY